MRWSASNTPTSTCHRAHESTQSAPASFSFWANGVKSGVLPGTTTTGIVSSPISLACCSANSSSIRESGMSCAAKPTFTFLPPACPLMKPSAKRLSHFEPNDVEQKIRGLAAAEQQRDLLGLRLGHERLVRRRGRRVDHEDRALGQLLGVGGRALRLAA